jgi:hypothetical protein
MSDEISKTIERVLGKGINDKLNSQGGQAFLPAVAIMTNCLLLEELRKLTKIPGTPKKVPKGD